MNTIILTGRLTKDIEVKLSQSGKSYSKFSLAVERPFSKDGEADFINCAAFNKLAELMSKYLKKGNKIGVNGYLQMNKYEVKGEKRTTYEVIVNSVEFLEYKEKGNTVSVADTNAPEDNGEFPF